MSHFSFLSLTAAAALLAAALPSQASSSAVANQPAPWYRSGTVVVREPDGTRRVVASSEAYRPYTRTDIEGLRLMTRMR